ncbi:hypothetical protein BC940DRAFT_40747 [Gongronella butleri]|nr:hypothetical protein BC940DRAFT_40747 [Gongronella butleri]
MPILCLFKADPRRFSLKSSRYTARKHQSHLLFCGLGDRFNNFICTRTLKPVIKPSAHKWSIKARLVGVPRFYWSILLAVFMARVQCTSATVLSDSSAVKKKTTEKRETLSLQMAEVEIVRHRRALRARPLEQEARHGRWRTLKGSPTKKKKKKKKKREKVKNVPLLRGSPLHQRL